MASDLVYPRNVHKKGTVTECKLVSNDKELKEAIKAGYVVNPIDALTAEEVETVRKARIAADEDVSDLPVAKVEPVK